MVARPERRRHRRHDLPCRIRVELPTGNNVHARTVNVCDGGAYFVVDDVIDIGREVQVQLTVPRDTANTFFLEQFAARAQVIRCEVPSDGRSGMGVALRFEKELALNLL